MIAVAGIVVSQTETVTHPEISCSPEFTENGVMNKKHLVRTVLWMKAPFLRLLKLTGRPYVQNNDRGVHEGFSEHKSSTFEVVLQTKGVLHVTK